MKCPGIDAEKRARDDRLEGGETVTHPQHLPPQRHAPLQAGASFLALFDAQPSRALNSTGPKRSTEPAGTGDHTPGERREPFTSVPLLLFSSRTKSWP